MNQPENMVGIADLYLNCKRLEYGMDEWEELRSAVSNCTKCRLHEGRKHAVLGEGPLNAELMMIGEAPGAQEDMAGRPFVGAAGKLLNDMLGEAGLSRDRIYITNIVKCRPPNNREPLPDEEETCMPYLVRQIVLVRPRLAITMGKHSSAALLSMAGVRISGISEVRGHLHSINVGNVELTVLPTYHPAAAIYNPRLRAVIVRDLRIAAAFISGRGASILDFIGDEEHRLGH